MKAHQILESALSHLVERGKQYDKGGKEERSMAQAVGIFEAMTGHKIPETDGWLFMLAVKLARSRSGAGFKADTYEDAAAYIALAAESAACADRPNEFRITLKDSGLVYSCQRKSPDDWDASIDDAISPTTKVHDS